MATSAQQRFDWVDTAKGLSILMVVMLYATYSVGEDTGGTGALHLVAGYLTPFRMPDFFAISGLFLSRSLKKDTLTFLDRRVFHYAYFYLLWLVIHIAIKVVLATGDVGLALGQTATALVEPYGVLWFIYVLAMVNLAVKLLQVLRVPHWLALALGAALQIADLHTGFYAIDQFSAYFVYFYAGYALAPLFFEIVGFAQAHKRLAVAGLAIWAIVNGIVVFLPGYTVHPNEFDMGVAATPGLRLVFAFLGMQAIFVTAGLLTTLPYMRWLAWIGARSIVLYVAFALPMTAVRAALIKFDLISDITLLSVVVYAAALIGPFVLYALVQKTGYGRFLFERPAWLHLDRLLPSRRTGLAPAE
jgi:uncharacterized membrane protein YcfT